MTSKADVPEVSKYDYIPTAESDECLAILATSTPACFNTLTGKRKSGTRYV